MSDVFQGEGWWMASDGKWYAPQLHHDPAYRAKYAKEQGGLDAGEPASSLPEPETAASESAPQSEQTGAEVNEAAVDADADLAEPDGPEESAGELDDDLEAAVGKRGMPAPVVTPVEPVYDESTAAVVANAAPPPEIRWPDLPGAEETATLDVGDVSGEADGESPDELPPVQQSDDLPTDELPQQDEGVDPADADHAPDSGSDTDPDSDWISHGPSADDRRPPIPEDRPHITIARPAMPTNEPRPSFEADRPASVGEHRPASGSRAQLELGRAGERPVLASTRAPSSTISMDDPPRSSVTTASTEGLSEIRIYREPAEMVDRLIAATLFLAGLAMIVGTFVDWVHEAGAGTTGWERGDGIATVFAGVLGAAAAGPIFVGFRNIVPKTVAIVCGLVGAVVAGLVGLDVMSDTSTAETSIAAGFWVVLVGALVMIVAGVAERTSIR